MSAIRATDFAAIVGPRRAKALETDDQDIRCVINFHLFRSSLVLLAL